MEPSEFEAIMNQVYIAHMEKGYSPINQIGGYILEDDITCITNHNNARALMKEMDRRVLVRELLAYYFSSKAWWSEQKRLG